MLVVFHNYGNHYLSPFLKTGFKHVFCCVNDGDYWIRIDGQTGLPVAEVVARSDYDLSQFYKDEGYTVLEVLQGTDGPRLPFVLSNCVGATRAMLGIRGGLILTPYQLYKRLR